MFKTLTIKDEVKYLGIVLLLAGAIVFGEWSKRQVVCTGFDLQINDQQGNYFIDRKDIADLISDHGRDEINGGELIHTSLITIENRVQSNNFVNGVDVYKNHRGVLKIHVAQAIPIARVMSDNSSYYITKSGKCLPLSNKFTARVTLVYGQGIKNFLRDVENQGCVKKEYHDFFKYIKRDRFLEAQVAGVEINEYGELIIFPQVTKQIVEYGLPTRIVDKFDRLKVFYKVILKEKGWNYYDRVNLKYKDQIICS